MKLYWITIVTFLSAVWALNAHTDVAGVDTAVKAIASRQGPNQVLVSQLQFDQRAWVSARLRKSCPDQLILGSSTVGTLERSMFGNPATLNGWLLGSIPEDFEAMTGLLGRLGCWPKTIVLGLDGFLLNDAVTNERWRTLEPERDAYLNQDAPIRERFERVKRAFAVFKDRLSYQTTVASLSVLLEQESASDALRLRLVADDATLCSQLYGKPMVRHFDGHFAYCDAGIPPEAERVRIARTYVERDSHQVRSWKRVSLRRLQALERVIATWRSQHVRVVLVTPPYNPLTYEAVQGDPRVALRFAEMDEAIQSLAMRTGAVFLRLRDPANLGCRESEYYDSHHFTPVCARRLAQRIEAAARSAHDANLLSK
jgi:hypothetical protein